MNEFKCCKIILVAAQQFTVGKEKLINENGFINLLIPMDKQKHVLRNC